MSACVLSLRVLCTWIVSVSEQAYLLEGKIATARVSSFLIVDFINAINLKKRMYHV